MILAQRRSRLLACAAVLSLVITAEPATSRAAGLVVSAQDGKFQRVDGVSTIRHPPVPDSVVVVDTDVMPPRIISRISEDVGESIAGPPQSVALSPDGRLVLVGAVNHLDANGRPIDDTDLLVARVAGPHPGVVARLPMGAVIQGVAFAPNGTLAIACGIDGQVRVLRVAGDRVALQQTIRLGSGRLGSVAFAPDGRLAMVTRRDDGGVAVLSLDGAVARDTGTRLGSGLQPYAIAISDQGPWAIVGNVGAAGLPGINPKELNGGVDTVSIYELSAKPIHPTDHATVAAAPEGVAISPDGRWVAVQSMAGSFLPAAQAAHTRQGVITLFENRDGHLVQTDRLEGGVASQGIVFGHDGQMLLVQRNVEREIAVYRREGGKLVPTDTVFRLDAGPVAIRAQGR